MKYSSLTQSQTSSASCIQASRSFTINKYLERNYYFISFRDSALTRTERTSLHTSWKARISIHPEDFVKAWDIVSPYLFSQADSFKILDLTRFDHAKRMHESEKTYWRNLHATCLDDSSPHTMAKLRNAGTLFFDKLTPPIDTNQSGFFTMLKYYASKMLNYLKLYCTSKTYLTSYVKEQYEKITNILDVKDRQLQRFSHGMQITIYMLPGTENKHACMLKNIERQLAINAIRPGVIYATDRALGQYISIRHPGCDIYHDAVMVKSYNPDNIDDPFEKIPPTTKPIGTTPFTTQKPKPPMHQQAPASLHVQSPMHPESNYPTLSLK